MSKFHNPYHFVPLPDAAGGPGRAALTDEGIELPEHATHDRFVPNAFSGQITCRLTTVTPLVVGGAQSDETPKSVHPFYLPGTDDPGLAASELRGLISSAFETVTLSAFRVLDDRHYSYRKAMTEGLSALGLIVERGGDLHMFPLADPHVESLKSDSFPLSGALPRNSGHYETMFADQLRKVYFGAKEGIRTPQFLTSYLTNTEATGGPFYALPVDGTNEKIKRQQSGQRTVYFDLGDETDLLPEPWDEARHSEDTHIRGILRVLGISNDARKSGMPTKKHEFFIPLSKAEEQSLIDGSANVFPILPEALERFNALADERTADADEDEDPGNLLPYMPNGQSRRPAAAGAPKERPEAAYVLKAGDVVFFRPTGDGASVAELSLSSIWRGRVEKEVGGSKSAATTYDFVASTDPDLLPAGDPRKRHFTPAELLFGFVEHKGSRALHGRLNFSNGSPIPGQGHLLAAHPVDLAILNSPKPPSPNFYFRKRQGSGWIRKSALSLADHRLQGRKTYLHTHNISEATNPSDPRWTMHRDNAASGNFDRMRVRVTPILAGKKFEFKIAFNNLTRFELGALLYSLRPADNFLHKLGLGKPLGLGSVKIDPVSIEIVDRVARYRHDALAAPRIAHSTTRDETSGAWRGSLGRDADGRAVEAETLITEFRSEILRFDPAGKVLGAFKTLGDPVKVEHPVHYPQVAGLEPGTPEFERDRFQWYVANDHKTTMDRDRQHIGVVRDGIPALETLEKIERREHNRPGHRGANVGGNQHRHRQRQGG